MIHALAGTTLGRYQVIKYLASGGMAQVLLARSTGIEGFERYVVIKRIHPERALDEHAVKMFLDEARLAASLHHANIVQVHDIGQENGEYFFAMEYLHGEDLRRLLAQVASKHGKIPLAHVVTIVAAAASALHYAHEHRGLRIVHRDVSPANIIVCYDGGVKVVDFGIAKASLRSTETHSGTLKGKISYMSPEQCMGQPVDRRSDVFALAIVAYELITARRLFKGSSDFLTMSQIVGGNIPKPSTHRPDIPPELEASLMKALSLDADERYETADALRVALERCHARSSPSELADYLRGVFGNRVEPWLASTDDEPEISVVDFDGADTGVAAGPERMLTPPPGSLMARVKRKVANPIGIPVVPIVAPPAANNATDASTQNPVRQVVRALTRKVKLPRRRRWALVAAALGVVAIAVAGVLLLPRGDEHAASVTPPPAALPAPIPPVEPAVTPTPARPASEAVVEPSEPPAKTTPAPISTAKKKSAKKTDAKKAATKKTDKWDPTTLLPD